jgi:hypothetical protein
VEAGEFGADMLVEIHNDGPVTLMLEKGAGSREPGAGSAERGTRNLEP